MNTELSYILSLLDDVKPNHDHVIRVVYPGVLNKYENLYTKPTIYVDTLQDHKSLKIIEKHTQVTAIGCFLVLLFRNVKPIPLQWNRDKKLLTFCDDKMMPFHAWLSLNMKIQQMHIWDVDVEVMNASIVNFIKPQLLSIRSVVQRSKAIDKVKRIALLLQHSHEDALKKEAMFILEFLYHAEERCGINVKPQPFYPIEIKEKAQKENDDERDMYTLLCRDYYVRIESPDILHMLISCATDTWDEYGYTYPPFFSEYGKPVKSRYKLFSTYVESFIQPK